MAKESELNEIVLTLQQAQQNKQALTVLSSTLERYLDQQKKGLQELEVVYTQIKEGKLEVKKKSSYKGRKSKPVGTATSAV